MLRWAPYPSAGIVRIRFKGTADRIRISGSGPPLGSADTVAGVEVECECLIASCQCHRAMYRCTHVPASRRKSDCPQTCRDDGPHRGERLLLDAAARFRHDSDPRGELLLLRPDPGRSARPRFPRRRHTCIRNPGLRARWDGQSVHADHVDVHARRLVPHPWQHVVSVGLRRQRGRRDGPVSLRCLLHSLRPCSSFRAVRDRPRQPPCPWLARPAPSAVPWAHMPYPIPGPTCTRSSSSASTRP